MHDFGSDMFSFLLGGGGGGKNMQRLGESSDEFGVAFVFFFGRFIYFSLGSSCAKQFIF